LDLLVGFLAGLVVGFPLSGWRTQSLYAYPAVDGEHEIMAPWEVPGASTKFGVLAEETLGQCARIKRHAYGRRQ